MMIVQTVLQDVNELISLVENNEKSSVPVRAEIKQVCSLLVLKIVGKHHS